MMPQCPPEQKWADIDWTSDDADAAGEGERADGARARRARGVAKGVQHRSGPALRRRAFDGRLRDVGPHHALPGEVGGGGADLRRRRCRGGGEGEGGAGLGVSRRRGQGGESRAHPRDDRRAQGRRRRTRSTANIRTSRTTRGTTAFSEPELLPWLFAQKRGQPAVASRRSPGRSRSRRRIKCPARGRCNRGCGFAACGKVGASSGRRTWRRIRARWCFSATRSRKAGARSRRISRR